MRGLVLILTFFLIYLASRGKIGEYAQLATIPAQQPSTPASGDKTGSTPDPSSPSSWLQQLYKLFDPTTQQDNRSQIDRSLGRVTPSIDNMVPSDL